MQINQKDKSFALFLVATLVVIWSIYSGISYIFYNTSSNTKAILKLVPKHSQNSSWLNTSRPLEVNDLKDRIIIVDFWTYACINCVNTLRQLQKIEDKFGSKINVIGVHSGKFDNEKDATSVKSAIIKHDISHPVFNDPNFTVWKSFGVSAWPTVILINPNGRIKKTYVGEKQILLNLERDVNKMVNKHKNKISRKPLPIALEKDLATKHILSFPTKIEYAETLRYKNSKFSAIFIANTGNNDIVASTLSGNLITRIGSGKKGFKDGDFKSAEFNFPHGMLYEDNKLYVADTGNNAIRLINFSNNSVTTIIGSGVRGDTISGTKKDAKIANLASPWDLDFYQDKGNIAISNAGTHQILQFNIAENTIKAIAGSGFEGIKDGVYPNNYLAQPSGIKTYQDELYFIDAESSSLRKIAKDGSVTTLIGKGLFKFGHVNGEKSQALMQHPLDLTIDASGIYISDSLNHLIRRYDFKSKKLSDFFGLGKKGDFVGTPVSSQFNEPEGIISVANKFYIIDSNNDKIVRIDRKNNKIETINILLPLKLSEEKLLQYLPNLHKLKKINISSSKIVDLKINLKQGFKINESAPSFIQLLEIGKKEANLITSFDWNLIKGGAMKLPKLQSDKNYVLRGTIYYCQDKLNAICHIESYEQEIASSPTSSSNVININLGL